jgi:glucan-binding YG repeat protein
MDVPQKLFQNHRIQGGIANDKVVSPKTRWYHQRPGGITKDKVVSPKTMWYHQRQCGITKDKVVSPKTRWYHQRPGGITKDKVVFLFEIFILTKSDQKYRNGSKKIKNLLILNDPLLIINY